MAIPAAFCTLGMFIIDEIEYLGDKTPEKQVIGGAGSYAALGARLAAGLANAPTITWIVDAGSDFPPAFRKAIDAWGSSCVFRYDPTRLTTRAWNGYGPNEYRAFKYLTPKVRLDEDSLSEIQAMAKSFHMVCSPMRCVSLVNGIQARRRTTHPSAPSPIFVWEPVSGLCTPEEFANLCEAAAHVDIVSPNADELAEFFGSDAEHLSRSEMVSQILGHAHMGTKNTILIVREGAHGSTGYLGSQKVHLRAYHQHNGILGAEASRVIDPTGGGNTYLGALAVALAKVTDPDFSILKHELLAASDISEIDAKYDEMLNLGVAMSFATVAAGFAIEQIGIPNMSPDVMDPDAFRCRVLSYVRREKDHIIAQLQ